MKNHFYLKNRKLAFLLFLLMIFLLILLLTTTTKNTESTETSGSFTMDPSAIAESGRENSDEINEMKLSYSYQERSCGECHEGFYPFEVKVEMPKTIESDETFQYKIIVENSDSDTPHPVEDLAALITGIDDTQLEPYNDELTGSVRRFQSNKHTFTVEEYAARVKIKLTGESGVLGRNNLDIILTIPQGKTWSSTNSGVDEEILLSSEDLVDGGVGEYSIDVQYLSGLGSVSYSLMIDVIYLSQDYYQVGEDLNDGDSYTFSWTLTLTSEEYDNMGSQVSGTVNYQHQDGEMESYRYTVEITPKLVIRNGDEGPLNYLLENGQIIGLLSIGILPIIMLIGFSKTGRNILAKPFRLKDPQKIHCYFSLAIIIFAIIHATLLISGPYSWNASPNLFGGMALAIFGAIALTSFNRKKIIYQIGVKKWKRIHMVLSILGLLIVLYHAVTFGAHFI